jgi:crotonobetaine/carnitine-CoA ligase
MSATAISARSTGEVHPFVGRDASWLLDQQARRFGAKPFLIWQALVGPAQTYSYAAFSEETRAYAAGLTSIGVKAGDAVVIHLDNHPALLIAWFACARIGALAVTTNTRATEDELRFFLEHSRAVGMVTSNAHLRLVESRPAGLHWIACVDHSTAPNITPFEALRGDPAACPSRDPDPSGFCSVMYTSGTTSRPKGVVWTHANVLWGARVNAEHFSLTPADRCLVFLPLFHTVAFCWNVLASLHAGASVVLVPRFSASRFWDVARAHECSWTNMVGFTLQAIAERPDPADHRFRMWVCAGDLGRVRSRWGIRTLGAFGMTELISQPLSSDVHHTGPEGSVGRPNPEYQVSLRRPSGEPAQLGEVADLWIKGVPGLSIFHSYLNDPSATSEAFDASGWFCTGDQVICDADGHVFYAGRAKDMLKVGAENVAALEIEREILAIPGVREVAVVGRPDRMLDEVAVAFVVAEGREDAIRTAILDRCAERLSDFKRPRAVHFVDELPKGLLDKVLKRELRDLAIRLDSSSSQAN